MNVFDAFEGEAHVFIKLITLMTFATGHVDFGIHHGSSIYHLDDLCAWRSLAQAFNVVFIKS